MTTNRASQSAHPRRPWRWLAVALSALLSGCATVDTSQTKPIDRVLAGVSDPAMQARWRQYEAEGRLPPIDRIPSPTVRVSDRQPSTIREPALEPKRPTIQPQVVATVRPYSPRPVITYDGPFKVSEAKSGVLVGRLMEKQQQAFELHYKLPGAERQLGVPERATFDLYLVDTVQDSALQRIVVLRTRDGGIALASIAEGSDRPYRFASREDLTIEQVDAERSAQPPLRITYRGQSVVMKPGERKRIGESPLEAFVMESMATTPQRARLQEGQPYYVSVMVYRVE